MSVLPGVPKLDGDARTWRKFLGVVLCLLAVAAGLATGLVGQVPDPVPGWALRHAAVWRMEVFVALFALAYAILTTVALAFHGLFFTSLSTPAGNVADPRKLDQEQTKGLAETRGAVGEIVEGTMEGFSAVENALRKIQAVTGATLDDEIEQLASMPEPADEEDASTEDPKVENE